MQTHAIFALFLLSVGGALASFAVKADAPKRSPYPLRVSKDGRYLTEASGKPFLVVGDTAWSLIAQLNAEEITEYLEDRQKRGFNAIIVSLIEHKFATKAPAKIDGVQPFLKPGDFTQPNPVYFDYAHRAIAEAHRRGISVWLCPAYLGWGGGDEGFFQEVKAAGPAALRSYGRFVGARFKDLPNIVWMPGGDYAMPVAERWAGQELAEGIREGGAKQIMTAHGGQTSAIETFGDQPWIAVENVYRYQADLWRPLQAAYGKQPVRPFVLLETAYEGEHKAPPAQIRQQAWWAMTSGACGQFFGNNPIWHFDGPGYTHSRSADSWRKALALPGSQDMARLGAFFRKQPWHRLQPDSEHRIVTAGGGAEGTNVTVAYTPDRTFALLYIPSEGGGVRELTLDLSAFPASVAARWFNPAQDAPLRNHEALLLNAAGQTIHTPGDNGTGTNDWTLLLEAKTR